MSLNSEGVFCESALERSVLHTNADQKVSEVDGLAGRDGSWQPSARKFPSILDDLIVRRGLPARFSHWCLLGRSTGPWASVMEPAEVDWVPGAYSIIRTEVFWLPRDRLIHASFSIVKKVTCANVSNR